MNKVLWYYRFLIAWGLTSLSFSLGLITRGTSVRLNSVIAGLNVIMIMINTLMLRLLKAKEAGEANERGRTT